MAASRLVAKGAKRPHSKLRGVLQTFQPLSVSWSGKSELRTLIDAEWVGGMLPLEKHGAAVRLLPERTAGQAAGARRPHPALFDHYVATLNQLAHDEPAQIVLRKFERALLKETGVAADLTRSTTTPRNRSRPRWTIRGRPGTGAREARRPTPGRVSPARPCSTWSAKTTATPATQAQSKQLMRFLLAHHLGGAPLNTRQILIDLMQL
jgi:DNA repair protein RecO (recombination protein O)